MEEISTGTVGLAVLSHDDVHDESIPDLKILFPLDILVCCQNQF